MYKKNEFDGDDRPKISSIKIRPKVIEPQEFIPIHFNTTNPYESYKDEIQGKLIVVSKYSSRSFSVSYPYLPKESYTPLEGDVLVFVCKVFSTSPAYSFIDGLEDGENINIHIHYEEEMEVTENTRVYRE